MKSYEKQIGEGLAYACATLTARLGKVKSEAEREQDAALALAIVALVDAQRDERALRLDATAETSAASPVAAVGLRTRAVEDEPAVVINFERARAAFTSERSRFSRCRGSERRSGESSSPRLLLYRGE